MGDGIVSNRKSPGVRLDFANGEGEKVSLWFTDPVKTICARSIEEVLPALREVEEGVQAGLYAAGYLSYEAAPAFDPKLQVQQGARMPILWFGLFTGPADSLPENPIHSGASKRDWQPSVSRDEYDESIAEIHEAIARGETYQVNYTFRLRTSFTGDDYSYYLALAQAQNANYCAYLDTGEFRILSASPELFFRKTGNRLEVKPMKGTASRGRFPQEDREQAEGLALSEKNRAENLMIVDLLRNDLGRVSLTGSVRVPRLFETETYPTVHQMTSTVVSEMKPGTSIEEILTALFPSGSITGAPKIKTMELITGLENEPREIYCGSVGYFEPGGDACFNVAIRTVWIDPATHQAEYSVGGGITWDSTKEGEYEEALSKSAVLTTSRPTFNLLETIRLDEGSYLLLDRHMNRLAGSAAYFQFDYSPESIRLVLEEYAKENPRGSFRVRLLLSIQGEIQVEGTALSSPAALASCWKADQALPVQAADTPVSNKNIFLFHKTTHRHVYDIHRRQLTEGAFDILLWNEAGEATEFTTGNLIVELEGRLWTPTLECGLLAGTLREELLDRGEIAERVIQMDELENSTGMWFINSVRGWIPVFLDSSRGVNSNFLSGDQ